ncbi:hypothetical protein D3C84_641690 [compost metagenome]
MFFLDEVAVDHIGFGQLIAELLQIEGMGQAWNAQQQAQHCRSELAREKPESAAECQVSRVIVNEHRRQAGSHRGAGVAENHDRALATASVKILGEANCISRLLMSTATCTETARVKRSPVSRSLIR